MTWLHSFPKWRENVLETAGAREMHVTCQSHTTVQYLKERQRNQNKERTIEQCVSKKKESFVQINYLK